MGNSNSKDETKFIDAKIYKITSENWNYIYIGSTSGSLEKRLNEHYISYGLFIKGNDKYYSSFEVLRRGACNIEIIEPYAVDNKYDLLVREGFYQRTMCNVINMNIAGQKQDANYYKEYQLKNKEDIKIRKHDYHIQNKEKLALKNNEKHICNICNGSFTHVHSAVHIRTKKHQRAII